MTPPPVAVSLILCEQVIVDRDSGNPSPINLFSTWRVDSFPSAPQRFFAFTYLTNGRGTAIERLVASRLDTGEAVYDREAPISFPDPVTTIYIRIRVQAFRFPAPGLYEFVLFVDSDPVAQRRLRVSQD